MSRSSVAVGPLVHIQGLSIDQLPPGGKGVRPELDDNDTLTTNTRSEQSRSFEGASSSGSSSRPSTAARTGRNLFGFASRSSLERSENSRGDQHTLDDLSHTTTNSSSVREYRIEVPPRKPTVAEFVKDVLEEAVAFMDSMTPEQGESGWKYNGSPKQLTSIDARVQLLECKLSGKLLDALPDRPPHWITNKSSEFWAACISHQPNEATKRSCTFEELVYFFKNRHIESQEVSWKNFETVAREAVVYDTARLEVMVHGEPWSDITLECAEMIHTFSLHGYQPLRGRVYAVLEITAQKSNSNDFIIVTIPLVDFDRSPFSKHVHNKGLEKAKYVAIQRATVLKDRNEVQIRAATSIDFKGIIPSWALNRLTANRMWQLLQCIPEWIISIRNKPRNMWAD